MVYRLLMVVQVTCAVEVSSWSRQLGQVSWSRSQAGTGLGSCGQNMREGEGIWKEGIREQRLARQNELSPFGDSSHQQPWRERGGPPHYMVRKLSQEVQPEFLVRVGVPALGLPSEGRVPQYGSGLMPVPHLPGLAWSMTGRGMAVQMRLTWAVSWHPWCRLPSTVSTGPAAASWSSAATSRKSPHSPGWGQEAGGLPLPQVITLLSWLASSVALVHLALTPPPLASQVG
jgi:hypothetical protein